MVRAGRGNQLVKSGWLSLAPSSVNGILPTHAIRAMGGADGQEPRGLQCLSWALGTGHWGQLINHYFAVITGHWSHLIFSKSCAALVQSQTRIFLLAGLPLISQALRI